MQNLEQLKADYQAMGETIKKMENEKEWPKEGNLYFYINSHSDIDSARFDNDGFDSARQSFLGIFRTEAEAQLKLNLIKALCPSKVWVPEEEEKYFFWETSLNQARFRYWYIVNQFDSFCLARGNCFKTQQEAEAYGATLKAYADYLLKK